MSDWAGICVRISTVSGRAFAPVSPRLVEGGCINSAAILSDRDRRYFVKLNDAHRLDMFDAEFAGLAELAASNSIRVPDPLCTGIAGGQAFLVMEHIHMGGQRPDGSALAGRMLATLHRSTRETFGWHRDNTIGSTPQPNESDGDWVRFWRDRRLGFQLALAHRNGYRGRLQGRGERLLEEFPVLIDHAPRPSLLHGDLWGGNIGFDDTGNPVIYDPAVYFGDREADLAMTELFGGFAGDFYAAYREAWPLDPGYETRKTLYNLYHVLNHLNLFGGSYLGKAQGMIERLLAQVG